LVREIVSGMIFVTSRGSIKSAEKEKDKRQKGKKKRTSVESQQASRESVETSSYVTVKNKTQSLQNEGKKGEG